MPPSNNKSFDDFELTPADRQAWWEFIEHYQPEYYKWAVFYYSGEHDPDLEPDYVPQDMDINDYLAEFKGLPRIMTDKRRNTITVNGVDVKTYLDHDTWREKRLFFAKLKKTQVFYNWKTAQFKAQSGKCAWCRKSIDRYSTETHVDHVLPLLWWGTNNFSNFVLSCADCNVEKAASPFGYHGARGALGENRAPSWIQPNRYTDYLDSHPEIVKSQVDNIELNSIRNNKDERGDADKERLTTSDLFLF